MPASFGYPFFLRIFLPGIIVVGFGVYLIIPSLIALGINWTVLTDICNLIFIEKLIILAIFGILSGELVHSMDFYLYQFLEGIRFWPRNIQLHFQKSALITYDGILDTLNKKLLIKDLVKDEKEYLKVKKEIYFLTSKLRQYPFSKGAFEATDLGNIMAEYETYSDEQYGMDFNIYWSMIRNILPEPIRIELEARSAREDFCAYSTFIALLMWPFAVLRTYQSLGFIISVLVIIGWWIFIKYFLYKITLSAYSNSGSYIKRVFDLYRLDLAKKLGLEANLSPDANEKELWKGYARFLREYVPINQNVTRLD